MEQMEGPLELISNITEEFNDAGGSFNDMVNNVKQGWTQLKNGYEIVIIIQEFTVLHV